MLHGVQLHHKRVLKELDLLLQAVVLGFQLFFCQTWFGAVVLILTAGRLALDRKFTNG
jgi:hypothetical protein